MTLHVIFVLTLSRLLALGHKQRVRSNVAILYPTLAKLAIWNILRRWLRKVSLCNVIV